jgi:hypothetical protein
MSIEKDLREWLGQIATGMRVHYAHLQEHPGDRFAWFVRAGDEYLDIIDDSSEPDIIYFDLELHDHDLGRLVETAKALTALRDHRGAFGDGYVDDVAIDDHRDDYESQSNLDTLPGYLKAFRVIVSGYLEGE